MPIFSFVRRQTLIIGTIAIVMVLLLWLSGILDYPEARTADAALGWRGILPPRSPIVIVAIDDESLSQTGYRWPWSRAYLAQIINQLADGKPRIISVDIIFYEAQDGDAALAAALQRVPTVLANSITVVSDPAFRLEQLNRPVRSLAESATAVGLANFPLDRDGVARRILAYQDHNEQNYFHWAIQTAALYANKPLPSDPARDQLVWGNRMMPLIDQALIVNYRGPTRTFKTIPAYQVANGDVPPEFFKDKIVLVGATSQSLHDTYATPFQGTVSPMPGVEIGANAIETILTASYLYRLPVWANITLILAAGLIGLALNFLPRPVASLGIAVFATIGYGLAWAVIFIAGNIQLPVVTPAAALFLAFIAPTTERAITAETEKRRIRQIFGQFIAPEMVGQLIERGIEKTNGKRTELTLLFSDIRGFTKLAEQLTPDEIVSILNEYLAVMTDVIFRHGGTIDKFEGDAIIAFWGAPTPDSKHAVHALDAALAMQKELARLRSKWSAQDGTRKFDIGIGLNTGEAFVGLIGSQKRVNYTVIGDNVNLAARMQELTKEFRWPLLISESTYVQVSNEFDAELLEAKVVKGKSVPVNVYRVLGRTGAPEEEMVYTLAV